MTVHQHLVLQGYDQQQASAWIKKYKDQFEAMGKKVPNVSDDQRNGYIATEIMKLESAFQDAEDDELIDEILDENDEDDNSLIEEL